MRGHPPRPKRVVDPGSVRDCIQPRDQARLQQVPDDAQIQRGRRGPSQTRLQARNESTEELLRHLPAALGGYRAPASADPIPGSQQRQQDKSTRQHVQRRAASVDGTAQHCRPPWALDAPVRYERQPPRALDVAPGALTIDFSRPSQRHTSAQEHMQQQRHQSPGGVDGSSVQPRSHAQDNPDVLPQLPDIRNPVRGGSGRNTPLGTVLPGQGRRMRTDSPARRLPDRNTPDARRDGQLAAFVSKAEDANIQFRPYMEDRYTAVDPFMSTEGGSEQWAFFAVYDGHGGTQAAELCNRELHKQLAGQLLKAMKEQRNPSLPLTDEAIADALVRTFQVMDDQLLNMGAYEWGSTATVALVRRSGSSLRLHVANVGDSRALAIDHAQHHFRVSQDHRPSEESEARRVRQEGGFVQMGRVCGVLAVSRAFGDHSYKRSGVSWRPTISVRDVTSDMALVIGSDGLWDYCQDGEVRAVIETGAREKSFDLAPRLVADAKRRGSTDNTCCLVIFW